MPSLGSFFLPMEAMTAVSWNKEARGIATLIRKMNNNFFAKDEHGTSFCVNPKKNCEKITKLFELAFERPVILENFQLLIEAKHEPNGDFDWMAVSCSYQLQPPFIQKEIDNILENAAPFSSVVYQPKLEDQINASIDQMPEIIINDVDFTVAEVEQVNSKISIQNAFMSKILRAVAAEHNVHISQVAAACVKYCICNDSILFRMQFNDQPQEQSK